MGLGGGQGVSTAFRDPGAARPLVNHENLGTRPLGTRWEAPEGRSRETWGGLGGLRPAAGLGIPEMHDAADNAGFGVEAVSLGRGLRPKAPAGLGQVRRSARLGALECRPQRKSGLGRPLFRDFHESFGNPLGRDHPIRVVLGPARTPNCREFQFPGFPLLGKPGLPVFALFVVHGKPRSFMRGGRGGHNTCYGRAPTRVRGRHGFAGGPTGPPVNRSD